jgi:transcriptional regulator with XRE-family HTH domain
VKRKYRNLAEYFEATGVTKYSVARKLGVTPAYVSMLASGSRQPALRLALRIEALTGVPASALLSEERVA